MYFSSVCYKTVSYTHLDVYKRQIKSTAYTAAATATAGNTTIALPERPLKRAAGRIKTRILYTPHATAPITQALIAGSTKVFLYS